MLKKLWQGWMRIATVIGNFNSRVILTLLYVTVVLPFGIAVRLFADPLGIKKRKRSGWSDLKHPTRSVEDAQRQF